VFIALCWGFNFVCKGHSTAESRRRNVKYLSKQLLKLGVYAWLTMSFAAIKIPGGLAGVLGPRNLSDSRRRRKAVRGLSPYIKSDAVGFAGRSYAHAESTLGEYGINIRVIVRPPPLRGADTGEVHGLWKDHSRSAS